MTRTVNTQTIVGFLGADPVLRTLPSGDAVANISVGTSEEWIDKTTGEVCSRTEWHSVALYRRDAENAAALLRQGSLVYVQGPSKTRKYQDRATGEDRYSRTIEAKIINFLARTKSGALPDAGEALASEPGITHSTEQADHDAWLAEYDAAEVAGGRRRA